MSKRKWFPGKKEHYKPYFTYDHDHSDWKEGDWILFEHVKKDDGDIVISEPILGLFAGFGLWDQALVINYVVYPGGYADPELERIALWSDNVLVKGHWTEKPSMAELKKVLKQSRIKLPSWVTVCWNRIMPR